MSAPYSYEQINAHVSPVTPSVMHTKGNSLSYYFRKYLFLEAVSMVRWTLPETWPSNRLQYLVFGSGGVTVFNTDRYGLVYDRMGLTGINIFTILRTPSLQILLLRGPHICRSESNARSSIYSPITAGWLILWHITGT